MEEGLVLGTDWGEVLVFRYLPAAGYKKLSLVIRRLGEGGGRVSLVSCGFSEYCLFNSLPFQ